MLKWVFERITGTGKAVDTPIGRLPAPGSIDVSGLRIPDASMAELLRADVEGWLQELPSIKRHFEKFGDRLPAGLGEELAALEKRLVAGSVPSAR